MNIGENKTYRMEGGAEVDRYREGVAARSFVYASWAFYVVGRTFDVFRKRRSKLDEELDFLRRLQEGKIIKPCIERDD